LKEKRGGGGEITNNNLLLKEIEGGPVRGRWGRPVGEEKRKKRGHAFVDLGRGEGSSPEAGIS